jgi:hypothetical protein
MRSAPSGITLVPALLALKAIVPGEGLSLGISLAMRWRTFVTASNETQVGSKLMAALGQLPLLLPHVGVPSHYVARTG